MESNVLKEEKSVIQLMKGETCIFDTPKYDDAVKAQNFFKELGCEIVVRPGPHYYVKVGAMEGDALKLASRRVLYHRMRLTKWGEPR